MYGAGIKLIALTIVRHLVQLPHCSVIDYHCNDNCCNPENLQAIEDYYDYLIKSLQGASSQTVVKIPSKSLKPYWNDELDRQKEESILRHSNGSSLVNQAHAHCII
jgi:hypothetical protein